MGESEGSGDEGHGWRFVSCEALVVASKLWASTFRSKGAHVQAKGGLSVFSGEVGIWSF